MEIILVWQLVGEMERVMNLLLIVDVLVGCVAMLNWFFGWPHLSLTASRITMGCCLALAMASASWRVFSSSQIQPPLGKKFHIAALLEELKEFCTEEEFDQCRRQASNLLSGFGFRTTRTFILNMQKQFRERRGGRAGHGN